MWPAGDMGQNLSELAHGLGGAVMYLGTKIPTLGTCWCPDSGVANRTTTTIYPASMCQAPYYHPFWMHSPIKFWPLTPKVGCTICPTWDQKKQLRLRKQSAWSPDSCLFTGVLLALKLCDRALQIRRFHLQTNSSKGFLGPGFPLWPSLTLRPAHKAILPELPPSNYSPSSARSPQNWANYIWWHLLVTQWSQLPKKKTEDQHSRCLPPPPCS